MMAALLCLSPRFRGFVDCVIVAFPDHTHLFFLNIRVAISLIRVTDCPD